MLMLLFQVGEERWAIAATDVIAVVPNVELQKMSHGSATVAGLLNYHDEILPVIDTSALMGAQPAPSLLSTRIVIVETAVADRPQKIALIVDRAGETIVLSERISLPVKSPYAQSALKDAKGEIIQQLAIAPLAKEAFTLTAQKTAQETALRAAPKAALKALEPAASEINGPTKQDAELARCAQ